MYFLQKIWSGYQLKNRESEQFAVYFGKQQLNDALSLAACARFKIQT